MIQQWFCVGCMGKDGCTDDLRTLHGSTVRTVHRAVLNATLSTAASFLHCYNEYLGWRDKYILLSEWVKLTLWCFPLCCVP